MRITKLILGLLLTIALYSCHDKPQIQYRNRVAQDLSYRLGKWYSISDGAGYGFTESPLLDTIWFISDTLAGWSHFVPHDPHAYAFRKTYFQRNNYIVFLAQNPLDTLKTDTVVNQCGMTVTGDTFVIYWDTGFGDLFPEHYLKKK
ncbi:MAG: hypothetical protein JWO03_3873 [Bacteroidetes bacterium]|nr:hypothetical protein [Bacteroidota bacterium]